MSHCSCISSAISLWFRAWLLLALFTLIYCVPRAANYAKGVRRGGRRNQSHSKIAPKYASWTNTRGKILTQLKGFEQNAVKVDQRNLVIYHVGDIGLASNSIDVASNNLKLFLSAMQLHDPTSHNKAFYLFNVVGGLENPLANYIPVSDPNVGVLEWSSASSDLDTHLRTMRLLSLEITAEYNSILFINQGVRGPLSYRRNGEWLGEFKKLMDRKRVAMVGPTLSCEVSPHVQTHVFALKTTIIPLILHEMKKKSSENMSWKEMIQSLEVGMTGIVRKAGYDVAALLYDRRGYPVFEHGKCLTNTGPTSRFEMNPTSWCDVEPEEVIFVKWGGEPMRTPGFMCNITLAKMDLMMEEFVEHHPEWQLTIPEALMGGAYYDLFREYNAEAWRDRRKDKLKNIPAIAPPPASSHSATAAAAAGSVSTKVADGNSNSVPPKVCFVVRVHSMRDDYIQENSHTHLMNKDVALLMTTLQRQINPNWLAFFFLVDHKPLEVALKGLLRAASDPRAFYVPTDATIRPPFTTMDGASTVTDFVLRSVVLPREECEYVSITSGDNAYGSEVVERVLNARHSHPVEDDVAHHKHRHKHKHSSDKHSKSSSHIRSTEGTDSVSRVDAGNSIDMVIIPLDSRRFLMQDHLFRTRLLPQNQSIGWKDFCVGIDANLEYNQLSYAVRPIPAAGRVDPSAVFLYRQKFQQEAVSLGNFSSTPSEPLEYPCLYNITDPPDYPCLNNAAVHMIEYLVRRRRWSYARLPMDGMKSLVFHGNSPTLCIGAGNVWFDAPRLEDQTCLTHKEILRIGANPYVNFNYDFKHFDAHGEILGTCLRLKGPPYRKGYRYKDWLTGFAD